MALTPRTRQALAIVQIDHTLVDIMVVDEVLRESMGRPWITVVIDIATRVVLGFALRLDPPSATSVGLALTMACLPKNEWLKERLLDFEWAPAGVPKLAIRQGTLHLPVMLPTILHRHSICLVHRYQILDHAASRPIARRRTKLTRFIYRPRDTASPR
jgi:hypothetical protein